MWVENAIRSLGLPKAAIRSWPKPRTQGYASQTSCIPPLLFLLPHTLPSISICQPLSSNPPTNLTFPRPAKHTLLPPPNSTPYTPAAGTRKLHPTARTPNSASEPRSSQKMAVILTARMSRMRRKFRAIAVATDISPPASPCGMCRQL
jgi:hypothetical protein